MYVCLHNINTYPCGSWGGTLCNGYQQYIDVFGSSIWRGKARFIARSCSRSFFAFLLVNPFLNPSSTPALYGLQSMWHVKYLVSILRFFFGFSNLITFKDIHMFALSISENSLLIANYNVHGQKEIIFFPRKWWQSTRRTTTVDHDNLIETIQLSPY